MTVHVTNADENYTPVMVSSACPEFIEGSNHASLSFDRFRMTRVEINNNSGLSTHFQMKSVRVSMAGGWITACATKKRNGSEIPACGGETTYCGDIEMMERETSAAALAEGKTGE